ncbi:MAG: adenylate/guanylate cyclase domain-containing protein [Actinomycetota bacterium]
MQPETAYTTSSGDVSIAYQVVGDGPIDMVIAPGWIFHLDLAWEDPSFERMMRRLTSAFRVIVFNKRGTGLSDRAAGASSPEERMDDIRAVMEAAGAEWPVVMGWSEGASIAMLFAATFPTRTRALVMYAGAARFSRAPDYPIGFPEEVLAAGRALVSGENWGKGNLGAIVAPSQIHDERFRKWFGRFERLTINPRQARQMLDINLDLDLRHVLPLIQVPTLILHQTHDMFVPIVMSRYMAERIPGATLVELPGQDHLWWFENQDDVTDAIVEFVTGSRPVVDPDRVLATVLFTDIVGSTERAAALGDARWRDVLEAHDATMRRLLERYRGREVKTTGDGFLATFDGPARGVRCAWHAIHEVARLGVDVRAGVHTGECEVVGTDVRGLAVHIGSRIAGLAAPREVLASSTVKDLVAGSGIEFEDRGRHALRGVPGEWQVFAATAV